MCKLLYNNILVLFLLAISVSAIAQSVSLLKDSKLLSELDLIEESIYYPLGNKDGETKDNLIELVSVEEKRLIQTLQTATLSTSKDLKAFDKFLLSQPNVKPLFERYLNYTSLNGMLGNDQFSSETLKQNDLAFVRGYEFIKSKNYNSALKAFEKCNDVKSAYYNHSRYYSGLINILNRDFDKAHVELKKVGHSYQLADHLPYYLAVCHFASERYSEVITWYEPRLNERALHNYEKLKELVALAHYKLKNYDESIKFLDEENQSDLLISALLNNHDYSTIIKKFGDNPKEGLTGYAQSALAEALYHDQEFNHSIDRYTSIVNIENKDKVNYNIAQNYIALKDYDEALSHLSLVRSGALGLKANDLIASLIINSKQFNSDLLDYNLISQLSPEQKNLLLDKVLDEGRKALLGNDVNQSERYLATAERISLSAIQTKLLLSDVGWYYFTNGDFNKASKTLRETATSALFEKLPDLEQFRSHYALGYIALHNDNVNRAIGSFSASQQLADAAEINPILIEDVYNRIGDCYYALEDYERSQEVFKKAYTLRINQGDHALYRLGAIQKLKNNPYEQIMIYEELIEGYPNSEYRGYCNLEIGNRYFELGQYDNAKQYYQTIAHTSDHAMSNAAQLQLGLIYVNAGDYDTAENYYQKVLKNDYSKEYVVSAQKALKELYASYKIDADSYAQVSLRDNQEKDETAIKLEFAIEQYNNGNHSVAIEELELLRERNDKLRYTEQIDYYAVLSIIEVNKQEAIKESIAFCEKYSFKKYIDVTDKLSELLIDQGAYKSYIACHDKGWFDTRSDKELNLISALIQTKQSDVAIRALQKNSNVVQIIPDELITQLVANLAKRKKWNDLIEVGNITKESTIWSKDPKMIYVSALSFFNVDQIDQAINQVTSNYDKLVGDPSWFAKATILLSDCYYIKGEKTMAIAALEAMIQSNMTIPPTLLEQAKSQLSELNL